MKKPVGVVVTKQESTKQQYRKNYFSLERAARRAYAVPADEAVTPQQVAATFLDNEPSWERSTARLYRASLVFVFEELNDLASLEAKDMIYHVSEDGEWQMQIRERVAAERKKRKRTKPRTSAQKAKSMSPEDMLLLREEIDASYSRFARSTRLWFFAGVLTGLRPSEWRSAELVTNKEGHPVLVVENGKNSNGRAHGPIRRIGLRQMSESNLALISAHLKNVQEYESSGKYEYLYYNCRKLLQNVADRLWPRRLKHPSLYTSRHVFSGDAKQVFDRIAVAALMGHASTDTAYEHYGKRSNGSGGMGVSPSAEDMKAVAERNPNYTPGEPGSDGAQKAPYSKFFKGDNDAANKG